MSDEQLYLIHKGQRIPLKDDLFKYGGGISLALDSGNGVHVALVANAATWEIVLSRWLAIIRRAVATNDQAHISRPEIREAWRFNDNEELPENIAPGDKAITINDLRPGDSAYNWRLLVRRFPWLFAKDYEYKDAVKYAQELSPVSGIDSDLEAVLPYLDSLRRPDGSLNQSEIGRLIGCENAGAGRRRILRVVAELERLAA